MDTDTTAALVRQHTMSQPASPEENISELWEKQAQKYITIQDLPI
jgi:hypothetical protein